MEILKVSLTVFIVTLSFIAITSVDAVYHNSADSPVTISTPQDGTRFAADQSIEVNYRVTSVPPGDHVHLYVDGKEVATLREPEGSHEIPPLETGRHTLAIKVVNRAHASIGAQASVAIQVD